MPVEGWLHFHGNGVQEKDFEATVYRLSVLTPNGGISTDIKDEKHLDGFEGNEFQHFPYAAHAKGSVYH